jgi:hypothetical protein
VVQGAPEPTFGLFEPPGARTTALRACLLPVVDLLAMGETLIKLHPAEERSFAGGINFFTVDPQRVAKAGLVFGIALGAGAVGAHWGSGMAVLLGTVAGFNAFRQLVRY